MFFHRFVCRVEQIYVLPYAGREVAPVGFEPAQLALVELESTPLHHSGKVSGGMTFGVVHAMHGRSRV